MSLWLFGIAMALAGPVLSVADTKGRPLEIELISVTAGDVRFKRVDNAKEFTLPLAQFDEASQAKIKEEAADLPPVFPPFDLDVVIGKRHDQGDSYYIVDQRISATVKMKNQSTHVALPPLNGRIVFIGRDQRTEVDFIVLSSQDFKVGLKPGEASESELTPFVTRYDGDKKGKGNVGGFEYFGYLLVFLNDKDEIVYEYTTSGPIRKLVTGNKKLAKAIAKYAKSTSLNENLEVQSKPARVFTP